MGWRLNLGVLVVWAADVTLAWTGDTEIIATTKALDDKVSSPRGTDPRGDALVEQAIDALFVPGFASVGIMSTQTSATPQRMP